jgi:hypothetical protein
LTGARVGDARAPLVVVTEINGHVQFEATRRLDAVDASPEPLYRAREQFARRDGE